MKALLFPVTIALGAWPLAAQTTTSTTDTTTTTTSVAPAPAPAITPPAPSPMMERMLSSLTPDEKNELLNARTKAMADNPGLQTDEMGLVEKGMMLQSGNASPEDRKAFVTAARAYKDKLQAAMIKADPNIQPILTKLEAEGEKMRESQGTP
jgi:hypothetical protein